jgi:EAL domain-containing protein (putative c-di-GMP-specific phosphodiesterase class I)
MVEVTPPAYGRVMAEGSPFEPDLVSEFHAVLDERRIGVVFQPVVDLDDGKPVGFEALARGPADSQLTSPRILFDLAYRTDRVAELDWVCRAAAFREALAADLPPSLPLFVNVEPSVLGTPYPQDLKPVFEAATGRLRVVMEVTERSLTHDPAGLLNALSNARRESAGVALDDLGADPSSLAVMPLVRPDVIKYDLDVLKEQSSPHASRIITSVLAEAEMTGAMVLAEGVESAHDVATARAMGANLAQGWHFGPPGPLPRQLAEPTHPIRFLPLAPVTGLSPFETVSRERQPGRTTKQLLIPMSLHLEDRILSMNDPAVVLACFQDVRHFNQATRRRYQAMAERTTMIVALGRDMPPEPAPGVRGGRLDPSDPLTGEWIVIAIGTHYAVALLAHDRGDVQPQLSRSYDFVITHDRRLAIQAAQQMVQRLQPQR